MTSTTVDPITPELLQETLISVVRQMRANLVATAYSSIIYEAHDFSCVLVDGEGQIVAQAEDNPSHILPVPWSVHELVLIAPYNALETATEIVDREWRDVAAIIVEPVQRYYAASPIFSRACDACAIGMASS